MISCLNEIFVVYIPVLILLFNFFSAQNWKGKMIRPFKQNIIVLISFPILFVSTSFLVNVGKEISLPGFRYKKTGLTRPPACMFALFISQMWKDKIV